MQSLPTGVQGILRDTTRLELVFMDLSLRKIYKDLCSLRLGSGKVNNNFRNNVIAGASAFLMVFTPLANVPRFRDYRDAAGYKLTALSCK